MKHFLTLALALVLPLFAHANKFPVYALTNGVLAAPTNFFEANAESILDIVGTHDFSADLATKADKTNGVIITPAITGGTQASPAITTPAITGGSISNATVASPTVTGGTVTGSTITSPTINGGTVSNATVINSTITAPTLSSPTLTGTTTVPSGSTLSISSGGTFSGAAGSTITTPFITLSSTPSASTHGATKGYVDSADSGLQAQIDAVSGAAAGYITPLQYGADSSGVTNSTDAFVDATAAAALSSTRTLLIPAGRFVLTIGSWMLPTNITVRFSHGSLVVPAAHPTASYSSSDLTWPLMGLNDNVVIEGVNEFHFGGRRNESAYTNGMDISRRLSSIIGIDKSNIIIRNMGFKESFFAPLWLRRCTNVMFDQSRMTSSCQAIYAYSSHNVTVQNSEFNGMEVTADGPTPHLFTFTSNSGTRFLNNVIDNMLATAPGVSGVAYINLWGEEYPLVQGNHFLAMNTNSTRAGGFIYLDGGIGAQIIANQIPFTHGEASYGIQPEGATDFLIADNYIGGEHTGDAPIGSGIYMRNGGWESVADNGNVKWRDPGTMTAAKTVTYNGVIRNNRINGFRNGMFLAGSDLLVTGNTVTGAKLYGVRIEPQASGDDGLMLFNLAHKTKNIILENNLIQYNEYEGINLVGGNNVVIRNNIVANNNQSASGAAIKTDHSIDGVTTNGCTTTIINSTTAIGDDYSGYHIYFPESGEKAVIESNSSTAFTLRDGGITSTLISGKTYVVSRGILGKVTIVGNQIYDDQTLDGSTNAVSLDPSQTYALGTKFFVHAQQGQLFQPNRRIVLKGVLTSNTDATVRVLHKDRIHNDRYWVEPVTPTSGTFQQTAGTAVKAGTGTISYTDNASVPLQYQNRTVLSGSGTQFDPELDNNIWIRPGSGTWAYIKSVASDTSASLFTYYPSNFTNVTYTISRVNIEGIKSQNQAYIIELSPIRLDMRDNQIWDNDGGFGITSPQGTIDLVTAPDAIPRITGNSATPTIDLGISRARFTYTSSTTLTDLKNSFEGARMAIRFDGYETIGFASGGTKFKGNSGVNKTPAAGSMGFFNYMDGFWYVSFVE